MRIPEIRDRLYEIADLLQYTTQSPHQLMELSAELRTMADETRRRKLSVKTPPKNKKMTRGLKKQIVAYKLANPNLSHQEIAVALGVNTGRVSDALHGKRT